MKITKETLYRAFRTFVQSFIATACTDIAYIFASDEVNAKIIWVSVVIPALSTAIATVMNMEEIQELVEGDNDSTEEETKG